MLVLQLEQVLGVVKERLAGAVEEGLLAGGVHVAELSLQRRVVQLPRIEAEQPPSIRLVDATAACRRTRLPAHNAVAAGGAIPDRLVDAAISQA